MRVGLFGNKSITKIRIAQIVAHVLNGTFSPSCRIQEMALARGEEFLTNLADSTSAERRLQTLNIASRANESQTARAAEISAASDIILFVTPLLTNANLEFLLSVVRAGQTLYIIVFDSRADDAVSFQEMTNLGLCPDLVARFTSLVPHDHRRTIVLPRTSVDEEKDTLSLADYDLAYRTQLRDLARALNIFVPLVAPGPVDEKDERKEVKVETRAVAGSSLRDITASALTDIARRLLLRYLQLIHSQPDDVLFNPDRLVGAHMRIFFEIEREFQIQAAAVSLGPHTEMHEYKLLCEQINHAKTMAQDFFSPARSLVELSKDISHLCNLICANAEMNTMIGQQVKKLGETCAAMSSSVNILQRMARENEEKTLDILKETTGIYRGLTEKYKEHERMLKKQRKSSWLQTVILTVALAVASYGVYSAFQAGGMKFVAKYVAKEILAQVALAPVPAPLRPVVSPFVRSGLASMPGLESSVPSPVETIESKVKEAGSVGKMVPFTSPKLSTLTSSNFAHLEAVEAIESKVKDHAATARFLADIPIPPVSASVAASVVKESRPWDISDFSVRGVLTRVADRFDWPVIHRFYAASDYIEAIHNLPPTWNIGDETGLRQIFPDPVRPETIKAALDEVDRTQKIWESMITK